MSKMSMVARAVAWNTATGLVARVIGLLSTLVLTRFISPDDYGQVSTAMICVTTASMFTNLQFGQYLIANGYKDRGVAFHAAFYHACLGWTAIAAVFFARDPLGAWLGAPGMAQYVGGFVLVSAMELAGIVPEKMLARDLRFRVIALTRAIAEVIYVALALALVGRFGAMAIVLGGIGRSAFALAVFAVTTDLSWLRPSRLSWPTSLAMLRYSAPLAFANMTDFAATRWDNLVISRFHGTAVMGAYNLAYNLSQTSTFSIAEHIADVLFPSFASIEPRRRGDALVRALSVMTFVVFPFAFGLAAVATTVVAAVFPRQWTLLGPMLAVLSVHAASLPLNWTFRAYYKTQGKTTFLLGSAVFRLALLLSGLATIGRLGPLWACGAVDLAFVSYLGVMWTGLRREDASLMAPTARAIGRVLAACVPLVGLVLMVQALERQWGGTTPWLALFIEVPAGAVGYAIGATLLSRPEAASFLKMVGSLFTRARAGSGGQSS